MKKRSAIAAVAVIIAAAALCLFGSSAVASSVAAISREASCDIVVLMYHAIIDNPKRAGDYIITPDALRADFEYISKEGFSTVVMSDIIAYVRDGVPLPEKPIMITFDDGYYNNYLYAYPLLQEYKLRAVISIIAAETEKYSASGEKNANYTHLTWDMINEMKTSGLVEFQNHSYDLHKLKERRGVGRLKGESAENYRAMLCEDIGRAQQLYLDNTGYSPSVFTYPFGAYNSDSDAVLDELGFAASLGVEEKVFHLTRDPACLVRIPRYNRPSSRSAETIIKKALS